MNIPTPIRAATAVLLAVGMSALGATAAFADDVTPPTEPTSESTESSESADAAPTDPATTDPATTDPATTDPATTDPVTTDPATTDPVADSTPYKLLAWQLPCGVADPWCAPGQNLVHVLDLATPSLDALDGVLGTCSDWQVDLEWDSPTTTALIAAGVLTAPNVPAEDHATGSLGAGVSPWKHVDNADCAVDDDVDPVAVVTEVTTPPTVTVTPPTVTTAIITTRSTRTTPTQAVQSDQLPTLSLTGSDPIWMVWAAFALLAAGLVLMQVRARGA